MGASATDGPAGGLGRHPPARAGRRRARRAAAVASALLALLPAACTPTVVAGDLPPTLTLRDVPGGTIAVQDGIPVPTFARRPGPRLDLTGSWRVQRVALDSDVTLTSRARSLAAITAAAAGRQEPGYDDRGWSTVEVPGTVNAPPDRSQGGAWYRLRFPGPPAWQGKAITLKFGAVNDVADVWLNGTYLGYHEGGYTPFAFDATPAFRAGTSNVLAVRVDNPTWGTRTDIVPWGLTDWWNYGGITQPVWLEANPQLHLARVDVTPHIDGADVSVVVENRAGPRQAARVRLEVLAAHVDDANLLDPDPRSLIAPALPAAVRARLGETVAPGTGPFAAGELSVPALGPGQAAVAGTSFLFGSPDLWRPDRPALYVVRATLTADDGTGDEELETFGLRRITVDPTGPRLLLNGAPTSFSGVAVHDDTPPVTAGTSRIGGRDPVDAVTAAVHAQAERILAVHATLVRAGHTPANPTLLMLADRLGFAVWEEIPLYHFTPLTFGISMRRGIPQQMLREMALRDMNHPSVLFHGLANESTGTTERQAALQALRDIDRAIDGTRLTGQASYGFDPSDPTSAPLDVVGITSYFGVFYGTDPVGETRAALAAWHRTYPSKPLLILEYGRWADPPDGLVAQRQVFTAMERVVDPLRSTAPDGYVGAALWWTLDDYHTLRPGLDIERFGLFDHGGTKRPVADLATEFWAANARSGSAPVAGSPRGVAAAPPGRAVVVEHGNRELLAYLAYGAAFTIGVLALALGTLVGLERPGRRARATATGGRT